MYLKELTLHGFKPFASVTTLRFEPGITTVVGPSGSGKSNIIDALIWIMSEQGAKNLRGTSMGDVIFAGASSRPSSGHAQVSLTIDNSDHTLDIDYMEVIISRTIFRNGGSEYAISGSQYHLLDIQGLLSDIGLGQQMYVVVGQRRLDAILKVDPSGHRAFIEEAVGILKHRKRKERALRKLVNTEMNLSRLDDLLGKIRRQLGPLGRQAYISRRAGAIQISVRGTQARLYTEDAQYSMSRRDTVRQGLSAVRDQPAVAQHELAQVKIRIEQVEALSSGSSPTIARANQYWHEFSQTRERLNALAQLAEERSRSLAGQIVTSFGEDPGMLVKRAEELESQAAAQTKAMADARIAPDKATEERTDGEKKLALVRQTLTELRKTAQERNAQIARLCEFIVHEESIVQLTTSRAKDYASQRDSLTSRRDDAQQQLDALRSEADSIVDDDGAALDAARTMLAECRERLNERADKQREIQFRIISLKSKVDTLTDMLDSRDASRSLEHDTDVASLGRLTDFIHVTEGWEKAVAYAFDQHASAIVVPEVGNMLHALERVRENKLGKAVVLTANIAGDPATEPGTESEESSAENAGAAPQSDNALAVLVTVNPDAENPAQAEAVVRTVHFPLADVAAVGTADEAQQIVAFDEAIQAVTKNGETFTYGVTAVDDSSISQSDLFLAVRRDKTLAQVKQLTVQDDGTAEQVAEVKTKRGGAARLVDQEFAKRTETRLKAQQVGKSLKSATGRVVSFTRQLEQLDRKITETQENCNEHQFKLDGLNRALASAQQPTAEHAGFNELDERERTLERELNLTCEHEIAAKIAQTEVSRKGESLSRQAGLLRDNAKETAERRARIEALNDHRREQAVHLQGVADDARAVAVMVEHTLYGVAAKRDELQAATSSRDEELKVLRVQRNQIEPKVTDLIGREHALNVNHERLVAESGQLMQEMSDELGLTLEELVSDYGPEQSMPVLDDEGNSVSLDETEAEAETEEGETGGKTGTNGGSDRFKTVPYNRQEQKKRLDRVRRDLATLGKINPLATEEFEAFEGRNKYPNDQRNGVVKLRDDLVQLIKDLDSTIVQVFESAFDDTAKAFEQMLATLFPGGTGRLRLKNPEDMLTTGVLVEASPTGKRAKQLNLLSGGECSLTALALLLAIFTVRPSPFHVMDEVEAALDDVNLTHLINAFNKLRAHTRLIIITHQQHAMSIADALCGVTMRADSVIAVVGQKLE